MSATLIDVHNPATGQLIRNVECADVSDIASTIDRARSAQAQWAAAGFRGRAGVIKRFHDLVLARSEEVLDSIQNETGKARRDALTEIATVAGTARYYLSHGRRHLRTARHQAAVPLVTSARVIHKPLGVVGMITPFNYPFLLAVGDALPALLAGNAVVIKPSELTPLSALIARDLLVESGLDPTLFTVLVGSGPELGEELIRHVDYVSFTGSTAVGRKVAVAAAERLIPCSLELGGKNAMVVLRDAPLDDAVSGLLNGGFSNSGQTCIAIERVYIEQPLFDTFAARAAERVGALEIGWSTQWSCDMGSLVSEARADAVEAHIDDAVAAGATVLVGGRRRRDLGPAFVEPTLLTGVEPGMDIYDNETFGPVVALYPVADSAEAVRRANESRFGLNATVWAGSGSRARDVARRLDTGTTGVNSTLLIYNSFDVPMGGVGDSGLGRRHGAVGITRFTQLQSMVSSIGKGGGYDSLPRLMTSPRRAQLLLRVFQLWRRIPGLR